MTLHLELGDRQVSRPVAVDRRKARPVVITGGAGFIGCNLADRLLSAGRRVVILDNISRRGVRGNITWLRERHGRAFQLEVADVRDRETVFSVIDGAGSVYHLAAQVAVTASLAEPIEDFCVNAVGTLNVLEAIRAQREPPTLIYTSTNKVYGELDDVQLRAGPYRYEPVDHVVAASGINEAWPLDFYSPYGCSKGAADQYVRDYARSYDLPAMVFRMSCIYGPHQFGNEDQGWLAHFLISAVEGAPVALYGDGRQVRDVLFIDDLVNALIAAERNIDRVRGHVFNIGGGPRNTLSLLELLERIEKLVGERPEIARAEQRIGDQRYFVADSGKFQSATGWTPRIDVDTGIQQLYKWVITSRVPKIGAASRPVSAPVAARMRNGGVAAQPLP